MKVPGSAAAGSLCCFPLTKNILSVPVSTQECIRILRKCQNENETMFRATERLVGEKITFSV